ncbi:D-amino-acid oxidase, partial [Phenoliferia sp. Uapishka_3]
MLDPTELPTGVKHGATFDTLMIHPRDYLLYLLRIFEAAGGRTHRATLSSLSSVFQIQDAPSLASATAVVNCTGLGARELVHDETIFPTRGQLVLVRAPWLEYGMMRLGPKGSGIYTYTLPRLDGTCVIGGTALANDWDPLPRPETAKLIKERGIALCPELLPPDKRSLMRIEDLDVLEDMVGLRPTRRGGIRIEMDKLEYEGRMIPVLHHYG